MCAFGLPNQMFYNMTISDKREKKEEVCRGLVIILEGKGTRARIDIELKYMISSEWDCKVKRISTTEFLVEVPSEVVLNLLVKMGRSSAKLLI